MQFEFDIIKWFQDISNGFTDILAELITILGEQFVIVFVIAFIYFVYNKKLGETLAYSVLKGIFQASRPFELNKEIVPKRPETATGFSFPSGHTQNGASFFTSLGIIINKKKIWITFGIIIFLIALSRVYLGVHFPHDVIAGAALGIGCAFLGSYLYNKYNDTIKHKVLMLGITALIFFPLLFIFYKNDFNSLSKFRDFYTTYALYIGFALAVIIENKYVNFTCNTTLKKRIYRFIIALFLFGIVNLGLKILLPNNSIFIDMFRYFLTSFVPLGIFPLLFKKLNLL
jgi:membrane-associated phospholipid phosphatase